MMYPMLFDPTMLVLIPAILLTVYAQGKVKSSFAKYLQVPTRRGANGASVARLLLDQNGLQSVPVEPSQGRLSDHYDPRRRVLRLSPEVFRGSSVASVSVAAHEVGHAIQHARGYVPLTIRTLLVPVASFGSSMAWVFIMGGLFIPDLAFLFDLGIYLFGAAVAFQVITLPVELNASRRALRLLDTNGIIVAEEKRGARKVLQAAALTYVAAMAAALAQLVRLLLIRGRRR